MFCIVLLFEKIQLLNCNDRIVCYTDEIALIQRYSEYEYDACRDTRFLE